MTSVTYNEIKSRFLSKIEAYSFLKQSEDFNDEFIKEWLYSTLAQPQVRNIFSNVKLNTDICTVEFEMARSVDEMSDKLYVIELLATGIVYRWIEPKVKSELNLQQMYGGKEEKWFSEANHLNAIRELLNETKPELKKLIRDRSYIYNSYLRGS